MGASIIFFIAVMTICYINRLIGLHIIFIAVVEIVLIHWLLQIKRRYKVLLSCFIVLCVIGYFHYKINESYYIAKIEYYTHKEAYENLIQYFDGQYRQTDVVSCYIREDEGNVFLETEYTNKKTTREEVASDNNLQLYELLADLYDTDINNFNIYFDEGRNMAVSFSIKQKINDSIEKVYFYSLIYYEPEFTYEDKSRAEMWMPPSSIHKGINEYWYGWSEAYPLG